jgi:fumarate reductase flavoprotein subunit
VGILKAEGVAFETTVPVVIVGAGACGLTAALAASDAGAEVVVLERDAAPQGSTALSAGMTPACGTKAQAATGVDDSVEVMAADIMAKAQNQTDPAIVAAVCRESGPAVDWLAEAHGVELTLVGGFLYPGHSRLRMHAPASRRGADLIGALTRAAETAGVPVVTNARVTDLYAEADGTLRGLRFARPDRGVESLGCGALVLACNGYGGNPGMVRELIPEMAEADYFGHPGNQGDAIVWGRALGAATADLGAYQGHGSLAHPQGILITWALMMEGGIQVNAEGARFSNEHDGYSEQARRVMAQPGGIAWDVFDARLHRLGEDFEDYRQAVAAGALRRGRTAAELAAACGLPAAALAGTIEESRRLAAGHGADRHGRDFTTKPPLEAPFHAVKVTGALFHTQGGLVVNARARVLMEGGTALPNLFAAGGAARGVSGPKDWGYLSGNGLLTAVALGRIAGREAARSVSS